ncbi:MAG: NifB/NifX family molybdenum-iron cluster-binding protein [Collinsella sp.]
MASKGGRHHEGGNHVRQRQHLYALWPQRAVQDLRHSGRQGAQRTGRGHRRPGHGALAGLLANGGVDALICGGIGGGAINALAQAGITVYAGAQGNSDACVEALIAGTLAQNGEATCGCHGHDHDHAHEHGESCSCHDHHEHEGHEGCSCH